MPRTINWLFPIILKILLPQVANGVVKEKGDFFVQSVIVLHLLQQGHPMLEYEVIKGHWLRS